MSNNAGATIYVAIPFAIDEGAKEFLARLGDNPGKAEMIAAADELMRGDMPLAEKKIAARKLMQMMKNAGMLEHPGVASLAQAQANAARR